MATLNEYTFLADVVYSDKRTKENKLESNEIGWECIGQENYANFNTVNYSAFKKDNEIVIAFSGFDNDVDAERRNGLYDDQLIKKAIDLYIKTATDNPGLEISFTGHGFGGGIASMMAVLFDKKAIVFNEKGLQEYIERPEMVFFYGQYVLNKFYEDYGQVSNTQNVMSAIKPLLDYCDNTVKGTEWRNYPLNDSWLVEWDLINTHYNKGGSYDLNEILQEFSSTVLASWLTNTFGIGIAEKISINSLRMYDFLYASKIIFNDFDSKKDTREKNVINYYLKGEALSENRNAENTIYDESHLVDLDLKNQADNVDKYTLFEMPLLNAAILSEKFKNTLSDYKYIDMMFDNNLYGYDYRKINKTNFLIKAIQNQAKQSEGNWLDSFADDINKFNVDNNDFLVKGYLSLVMEYWYFNDNIKITAFTGTSGGVKIDFTQFDGKENDAKGINEFYKYLEAASRGVYFKDPILKDIFTYANFTHYVTTAKNIILGNKGEKLAVNSVANGYNTLVWGYDNISIKVTTGKGNDFVLGAYQGNNKIDTGSGNDTIIGFANDTLIGGDGWDTYFVNTNAIIDDSDRNGFVYLDNVKLNGAVRDGKSNVFVDGKYRYRVEGSTLFIYDISSSVEITENSLNPFDGNFTHRVEIKNFIPEGKTLEECLKEGNGKYTALDITLNDNEEEGNTNIGISSGTPDFDKIEEVRSPIVLDLNKNGIETTEVGNGAFFDHDGDGLRESTGWVAATDGLLVRDLNGDNKITHGGELFGNYTLLKNGEKAKNGFEALAELDENQDGVIDSKDSVFESLRVWQDLDGDGYTDEGELKTLKELGISAIGVDYKNINKTDNQGNQWQETAKVTFEDGSTSTATDVWFKVDITQRLESNDIVISDDIALLPNAKGFGKVHDLHEAMMLDPELAVLVKAVIAESDQGIRDSLLDALIYQWTGVAEIDPYSRDNRISGHVMDARQLEALEVLVGREYLGTYCWGALDPNPHGKASSLLIEEYRKFKYFTEAQILAYSHPGLVWDVVDSLFFGSGRTPFIVNWDKLNSKLVSLFNEGNKGKALEIITILDHLGVYSSDYQQQKQTIIGSGSEFGEVLSKLHSVLNVLYIGEANWPEQTIIATDETELGKIDVIQFNADISPAELQLRRKENSLIAIHKTTGKTFEIGDYFCGKSINVKAPTEFRFHENYESEIWYLDQIKVMVLQGAEGNDLLYGYQTDDKFSGSLGNDTLYGYEGNDTLYGNEGDDWLLGGEGNDLLLGGEGNDSLRGENGDDTLEGGAGNDTLDGGNGNDLLVAGEGNDELYGGNGNDTLIGGLGNDFLQGYSHQDTYIFDLGWGNDTVSDYGYATDNDIIQFTENVQASDLQVTRNENNLILLHKITGDRLTIDRYFENEGDSYYAIASIQFKDGTVWNWDQIKVMVTQSTDKADRLYGYSSNDSLLGGKGNDTLYGYTGDDTLKGEEGNDTLYGGEGNDLLLGGEGDDYLLGEEGDDTLEGGTGDDALEGGKGNATFIFEDNWGNDRVILATDENSFIFKEGIDSNKFTISNRYNNLILYYDDNNSLKLYDFFKNYPELPKSNFYFSDGTIWSSQQLLEWVQTPSDGDDSILGAYDRDNYLDGKLGNDTLMGGRGNDTLIGGEGNDSLCGGYGNNLLVGGAGDDYIYADVGNSTIIGGTGNDTISVNTGSTLIFDRGWGSDTVFVSISRKASNTITFGEGISFDDLRFEREFYFNTWDGFYKLDEDCYIYLKGTEDKITLKDYFYGKSGEQNDYILKFADGSSIGREEISKLVLQSGAQYVQGGEGDDYIITGDKGLGGAGNDTLTGTADNTGLWLKGEAGNDALVGGSANDTLYGGTGDDLLIGGAGDDYLQGDAGSDTYYFERGWGNDVVYNIVEAGSNDQDIIKFGEGIKPEELVLTEDRRDLIIGIKGAPDTIRVSNFMDLDFTKFQLHGIEFADGSKWTSTDIYQRVSRNIVGDSGDNILEGGARQRYPLWWRRRRYLCL